VGDDRAETYLRVLAEAELRRAGDQLKDGGGNWHVATAGEPWTFGDSTQAFRLRLTPPLTVIPGPVELVLTGPSTRVRVRFPAGS
jgi:hypothetical protein